MIFIRPVFCFCFLCRFCRVRFPFYEFIHILNIETDKYYDMNKQLNKIDETISWLENNAPEDACVILMSMSEDVSSENEEAKTDTTEKKVELKTYIEGYDEDLNAMLIKKMIMIPLLHQVFVEALGQAGVKIDVENFLKWREKNKYDLKFDLLDLSQEPGETLPGEPEEYIKVIQDFCIWMNEKPSRNLTLLTLAWDELNSGKTTFAMGFAPDLAIMLAKEMQDNYGFKRVVESAIYGLEAQTTFEEFEAWKEYLKKKG